MAASPVIECHTFFGLTKLIPKEQLVFRPSAYAVIVHNGSVLLVKMRRTGKWALPGGGIDPGEPVEEGLRREVREEVGLEIEILRFALFKEHFFYYDPADEAFHGLLFFYLCKPLTFDLLADEYIDDGEAIAPTWVEIDSLQADEIHQGQALLQVLNSPSAN